MVALSLNQKLYEYTIGFVRSFYIYLNLFTFIINQISKKTNTFYYEVKNKIDQNSIFFGGPPILKTKGKKYFHQPLNMSLNMSKALVLTFALFLNIGIICYWAGAEDLHNNMHILSFCNIIPTSWATIRHQAGEQVFRLKWFCLVA